MKTVKTSEFWVMLATIIVTALVLFGYVSPLYSVFVTELIARFLDCLFALIFQIFVVGKFVHKYKQNQEKKDDFQTPSGS